MRVYLPMGLLLLTTMTSCAQPLTLSNSPAPVADVYAEGRGSLDIALQPIAALQYATLDLLRDVSISWRPNEAARNAAINDARYGPHAFDCLAEAVYYEARSEPLAGQRAVAEVVLNRTGKRGFANSVCGVVRQRTADRSLCQFSFNCDGSMTARREPAAWSLALRVARQSLAGDMPSVVGAATYYHNTASSPDWASRFKRVAQIGSQIFYRS